MTARTPLNLPAREANKGPFFTPETDKINYLAKVAAWLDKTHAPKDPAWVFKALK